MDRQIQNFCKAPGLLFFLVTASPAFSQCHQQYSAYYGVNQASYSDVGNLSMDLDSLETPYLAYISYSTTWKINAMKFSGGQWAALDTAALPAKTGSFVKMTVDKHGAPCMAYCAGMGYRLSVVRHVGNAWDTIGQQGFTPGQASYPDLIFDKFNTPYVIFQDNANSTKASVMKYTGSSWVFVGSPGFSVSKASYLHLAIDTAGTLYAAFRDEATGRAFLMNYTGSGWVTTGGAAVSAGHATSIALALDKTGVPFVAYSGSLVTYKASVKKYNGSAWVYVGTQGFSPFYSNSHSLVFDQSGAPMLAYGEGGTNSEGPAIVMKYTGAVWSYVGMKDFSQGPTTNMTLVIGSSGTPFLSYTDVFNNEKASVMKFTGTGWSNLGQSGFSAGMAPFTSLAVDPSGTAFMAFQDMENGKKACVMKYNGTSWTYVGAPGLSAGAACYTHLLCDKTGALFLFYSDGNMNAVTGRIHVLKYAGAVWTALPDPGTSHSGLFGFDCLLDTAGKPVVAFTDSAYTNSISVKRFNGTSWSFIGAPGFTGTLSFNPSICMSPRGTFYMTYSDYNSSWLKATRYSGSVWNAYGQNVVQYPQVAVIRVGKSELPYIMYNASTSPPDVLVRADYFGNWNVVTSSSGANLSNYPPHVALVLDNNENPYCAYPYPNLYPALNIQERLGITAVINGYPMNMNDSSKVNSVGSFSYPNLVLDTAGNMIIGYQDGGAVVQKYNLIRLNPSSQTSTYVCLGSDATCSVSASAPVPLTYQWQVDSLGSGFINLQNNIHYSGIGTPSLTVHALQWPYDGYNYQCVVKGACFTYTVPVIFGLRAPSVFFSSLGFADTVCKSPATYTLSGGAPAGGVYGGPHVTGNLFHADTAGVFTLTYRYTDSTGCPNTASHTVHVDSPVVSFASLGFKDTLCASAVGHTLSGGSPAGGIYSGPKVNAGIFHADSIGVFTLTYTYTDQAHCSASASHVVHVRSCTGIEELGMGKVLIYPNPVTDRIIIQFEQAAGTEYQAELMNMNGQVIRSQRINVGADNKIELSLEGLVPGVYAIRLYSDKATYNGRFVKME